MILGAITPKVTARIAEVGPVHLVLGLLSDREALAARAITELGVVLEAVRERAVTARPQGPRARLLRALRLGHNHIGTEHILLALLDLENGAGVLSGLGLEKAAVEAKLLGYLS